MKRPITLEECAPPLEWKGVNLEIWIKRDVICETSIHKDDTSDKEQGAPFERSDILDDVKNHEDTNENAHIMEEFKATSIEMQVCPSWEKSKLKRYRF